MEDRLKKFAQLVDAGSFTKAAAEMHISQPALSAAIAKLERELKSRLLVRGARPLAMTSAGELAYQSAKELAVQADNLKLKLAELARQPVSLKIGMIDSVADALFESGAGLELMETAKVSVVVNNSRYLMEAVERGDLDIAFAAEQQRRLPAVLEAKPVATEPLVVVSHKDHPVPRGKTLPDFIAYDQLSNTFRLVQQALKNYGITPNTSFYSTSPEVILRLVLLNKGTAALPYLMVRAHINSGQLKRLGKPTPWLIPRKITAIKRRDRELPLALRQLLSQVGSELNSLLLETQATNLAGK
jgi:DNA-binding transcriptional LysR family regulator